MVRRFWLLPFVFVPACAPDDSKCSPDPPEPAAQPVSPWRADRLPADTPPDAINSGLPLYWEAGTVHVLAWLTVADDYWKSERTQALVVKRFDGPTEKDGYRWLLAVVYFDPKRHDRPWDTSSWHYAPPLPGEPAPNLTDAMLWGYEFYPDRPTDEQMDKFINESMWDPLLGSEDTWLSDATKVRITRTLTAGGIDLTTWRKMFDRDIPPSLFPELRVVLPSK
jgi:hypothetical protein